MLSNTSGYANTGLGADTLFLNTTGNVNTSVGTGSMTGNATGIQNTAIGAYSLNNTTSTNTTVAIGVSARTSNGTNSSIIIGTDAVGNGSNQLVIGSSTHFVGATGTAAGFATTSTAFVGGSALPALAKFLTIKINGTDYKIPLYNV